MTKSVFAVGFMIAYGFCNSALAADNCKDPQSQLAMNTCAAKEYEREDSKLNQLYKELVNKVDADKKSKLKEVQSAWIKYRDLQCDYDSSAYQGGTIYSLVLSTCLTQTTRQRNKDLKAMLEEASL